MAGEPGAELVGVISFSRLGARFELVEGIRHARVRGPGCTYVTCAANPDGIPA